MKQANVKCQNWGGYSQIQTMDVCPYLQLSLPITVLIQISAVLSISIKLRMKKRKRSSDEKRLEDAFRYLRG